MKNLIIMILATLALSGCALKATFTNEEIMSKSQEHFALAQKYEKSGELKKALIHFKIAGKLGAEEKKSTKGIERLSSLIKKKSATHYKHAQKLRSQKNFAQARNELIKALWYDNDNTAALQALKESPEQASWQRYTVEKGETLESIAKKTMGSKRNAFLIAGLNKLKADAGLSPGAVLLIPRWDETGADKKAKEPVETEEETAPEKMVEEMEDEFIVADELTVAMKHVEEKSFEKALAIISEVKKHDPENKEALLLENTTYCEFAKQLARDNDFTKAEECQKKVSPEAPCIGDMNIFIQKHREKESKRLYLLGVQHYTNENLQKAISAWEKTLEIDPEHDKAKNNIEKAKSLLERLNKVK